MHIPFSISIYLKRMKRLDKLKLRERTITDFQDVAIRKKL